MRNFVLFQKAVAKQFDHLKKHELFKVDVDKDTLWDTYLKSWPAGTNPIHKERTEYDCNCCKSFIRNAGAIVAIVNGKVETIWDGEVNDDAFSVVSQAMAKLIRSKAIENQFLTTEPKAGTERNMSLGDGPVVTWNHFCVNFPREYVVPGTGIGPALSMSRSSFDVFIRGLKELTPESVETTLDLIAQNSLYRGEEHKGALQAFQKLQTQFNKLKTDREKELFCWQQLKTAGGALARIRNSALGTLLIDISAGMELDQAVARFEKVMAPANYKRPTAVVTKRQIDDARKKLEELGLVTALDRRFAKIEDITINNILFVDRSARAKLKGNVFDDLAANVKVNPKSLDRVEEVSIEEFINNIMPKAEAIEVMVENRHTPNLVSLIAPVDPGAKPLFKWNNPFSWDYQGGFADSIKERVKRAGGKVDGDLRCSLSWSNYDDLDFHMLESNGEHISFMNKRSRHTGGHLDVDMNAGRGTTRTPVENIAYPDRRAMKEGTYVLKVHQYMKRESVDTGFEVEVEFDGTVHSFVYDKAVPQGEYIEVAQIRYTHKEGFQILKSLPSTQASKPMWGLSSQKFHKLTTLMLSPNYWDEKAIGNKHYFFMIEGCQNEGQARGFFNEFLSPELEAHRKVLELVGSKMKTDESDSQLSGLGFSSTQRNHLIAKVKGSFNRNVKVLF